MKTTRLATRLTIFFLLAVTLPLLISAVVFGLGFAQYSEQTVRTRQASIVAVGQAYIQNYFNNLFDQLFVMASFANLTDATAAQAVAQICQRAPQTYLTISISDFEGNERMRLQECVPLPETSLSNLRSQEAFFRAQRGETFIRSVSFDAENNPISTISFPGKSLDGQEIVFIAEVNLGTIWAPLNELNVGDDGYLYVVDQRGNLIGYRDQQIIAQQENLAAAPSVAPLLVGSDGVEAVQYVGLLGEAVIGSSALVQPMNWGLVLEQPTESIFAARNALATQFIVSI